jgi:hypothetical protein
MEEEVFSSVEEDDDGDAMWATILEAEPSCGFPYRAMENFLPASNCLVATMIVYGRYLA